MPTGSLAALFEMDRDQPSSRWRIEEDLFGPDPVTVRTVRPASGIVAFSAPVSELAVATATTTIHGGEKQLRWLRHGVARYRKALKTVRKRKERGTLSTQPSFSYLPLLASRGLLFHRYLDEIPLILDELGHREPAAIHAELTAIARQLFIESQDNRA